MKYAAFLQKTLSFIPTFHENNIAVLALHCMAMDRSEIKVDAKMLFQAFKFVIQQGGNWSPFNTLIISPPF